MPVPDGTELLYSLGAQVTSLKYPIQPPAPRFIIHPMRHTLTAGIFLAVAMIGCTGEPPVMSIQPESEWLTEGQFSIRIPAGWRIVSDIDASLADFRQVRYYFLHPHNRQCRFAVDVLEPLRGEPKNLNHTVAEKIRSLQRVFHREGFADFTVHTSPNVIFADEPATKLVVTAVKKTITRELVAYALRKDGLFYFVSYQWHDTWNPDAKKYIIQAVESFQIRSTSSPAIRP